MAADEVEMVERLVSFLVAEGLEGGEAGLSGAVKAASSEGVS